MHDALLQANGHEHAPCSLLLTKKAWMFEKWFHNFFVPYVKIFCNDNDSDYKILLLLDNAPARPSTDSLKSSEEHTPNKVRKLYWHHVTKHTKSILIATSELSCGVSSAYLYVLMKNVKCDGNVTNCFYLRTLHP